MDEAAGKGNRGGITQFRQAVHGRSAGISETEHRRRLVEGLPRRIVDRSTQ